METIIKVTEARNGWAVTVKLHFEHVEQITIFTDLDEMVGWIADQLHDAHKKPVKDGGS